MRRQRWVGGSVGLLLLASLAWGATVTKQLIGPGPIVQVLSGAQINGLAPNASSAQSAPVDNRATAPSGGGGALLCEVEALVTFVTTPDPDGGIAVWFQEAVDDNNYATAFIGNPKLILPVNLVSPAVTVRVVRRVDCPAGLFTVAIKNDNTGAAFSGSGNSVSIRFVTLEGL
jgi:hypothetical protein